MFTENKITEFTKTVADLPDRPQMTAQALKAYFDSSAEELRVKFNALIDALDTFGAESLDAVDYNAAEYKLTFSFKNGSTQTIDLPLELLIESGHYDADAQSIVLTLANGDALTIPVSDLIDEYEADEKTLHMTASETSRVFSVKDGVFAKTDQLNTAVADIKRDRKLKLLKTITLEEDVAILNVEFDNPIDEIAILYNIAFTKAETSRFATRGTDSVFLFYRSNLSLSTNKRYWYAHAKEIGERQWVCLSSEWFSYNNGLGDSTTQPRTAFSSRANHASRYIKNIDILIPNNTSENAFAAGSTIQIWGHEADENL